MEKDLNKRVVATESVLPNSNNKGVLIRIEKSGQYPYIIKFDTGSTYGVSKYKLLHTMKKEKLISEINILCNITGSISVVDESFSVNYLKYLKKKLTKHIVNWILEISNSLEWVDEKENIENILEQITNIIDRGSLLIIRKNIN